MPKLFEALNTSRSACRPSRRWPFTETPRDRLLEPLSRVIPPAA